MNTRRVDQDELLRLAVLAAQAAGLPAEVVQRAENHDDPDLPAIWVGDAQLAQIRSRGEKGEVVLSWQMNSFDHYAHLLAALSETIAAEAVERAQRALMEAGLTE